MYNNYYDRELRNEYLLIRDYDSCRVIQAIVYVFFFLKKEQFT